MIRCQTLFDCLRKHEINFYAGVPDSLLKDFCAYITDHVSTGEHIITANEGNAVALAAGHYLATRRAGLVYLQNSGLGNTINPLLSLLDKEVYRIPVLFLIGWRGEPGKSDEPQHVQQGKLTLPLLESLELPHKILSRDEEESLAALEEACVYVNEERSPYSLIVQKDSFEMYELKSHNVEISEFSREEAIHAVFDSLDPETDLVLSTTGKISRELYEYRQKKDSAEIPCFYNVGSMGHVSQISLGVALARPDRNVYCLDGDGAALMHLGGLAIIGQARPPNYSHIVFNNASHESVGGQPTVGGQVNFLQIAKGCGYQEAFRASDQESLVQKLTALKNVPGPRFLEIQVKSGSRSDLARPQTSPEENKNLFMDAFHD